MSLGQTTLENLLESQEATRTPLGDNAGSSHSGELVIPQGNWRWQTLFWSPPTCLLGFLGDSDGKEST